MPLDLNAHIQDLCHLPAPSGHEAPARAAIRAAWEPFSDTFKTDGLGSLIATQHGSGPAPRPTIMLAAHMDEIGLIVSEVRDGFIRTAPLGGIDFRVMLMQPVIVHAQTRALRGVFGAAPPHMTRTQSSRKYPTHEDLWIDVGLPADEVHALVRVGDVVTFDAPSVALKGERIVAKSLDNRASVAAVTLCLELLRGRDHAWDVAAVATVQEEVGHYGAMAAAHLIQPDLAIAIDVTFATQRGVGDDSGFALGGGPTLGVGPNFHPQLVKALRKVAKTDELKLQTEALPGSTGTDAWDIQTSRAGVPTALISIPIRNMHTPSEIVDVRDVQRAGRLLAAFIASLTPDFVATTLTWPELDDALFDAPTGEAGDTSAADAAPAESAESAEFNNGGDA